MPDDPSQHRSARATPTPPAPLQAWGVPSWSARLDNLTLLAITVILALPTLAFGGVEGWSQLVLTLVVGGTLVLVLVRAAFDPEAPIAPRWVWAPLIGVVALAGIQLVPLLPGLMARLSPHVVADHTPLLEGEKPPERMTLSLAPLPTQHALRLALIALAMAVIVGSFLRSREHLERLLTVVFGVGCVEAALCVAQVVTGADKLYWAIDAGGGGMLTAGSFVNHSHFSQLVNLAIGAGIGLLLVRLERRARREAGAWKASPVDLVRREGWLLGGLALCVFAVCLSLSRNGVLSLLIGVSVAGALLGATSRLSWRGWLLACVPLLVFGGLVVFGFDVFYDRLGTLKRESDYIDRWALTLDSLRLGADYPVFGVGLGAYPLVFPAYDQTGSAAVAAYADNDYAQVFAEGGAAGVLLLASMAALLAYYVVRALRDGRSSASQAVYGLTAGLLAVAIHSLTDFGQRLPAVFLTTVTLCVALAMLTTIRSSMRTPARSRAMQPAASGGAPAPRRLAAAAAVVVLAPVLVWMLHNATLVDQAERWWAAAQAEEERLRADDWRGSDLRYQRLLTFAENALAWRPGDVDRGYWLNYYRWMSLLRQLEGLPADSGQMQVVAPIIGQIADDLASVRRACPTFFPPYVLEGRLRGMALGDRRAADRLFAAAGRLAASDPQAQLACGEWAATYGEPADAQRWIARAVSIDGRFFDEASRLLIERLDDPQAAIALADDRADRLQSLARLLAQRGGHEALAESLSRQAEERLARLAEAGQAAPGQLAALAQQAAAGGDHQRAAGLYRQALASDYNQVAWRIELARSLKELGEYEEGLRHVRICLRVRPGYAPARQLADELALLIKPSGAGE